VKSHPARLVEKSDLRDACHDQPSHTTSHPIGGGGGGGGDDRAALHHFGIAQDDRQPACSAMRRMLAATSLVGAPLVGTNIGRVSAST
jgi:hypothetical protein